MKLINSTKHCFTDFQDQNTILSLSSSPLRQKYQESFINGIDPITIANLSPNTCVPTEMLQTYLVTI